MKKMLLAALALSPGSKAITEIDEHQRLIVADHLETCSAFLVDLKAGDVTHCNERIAGFHELQDWVENRAYLNIDIFEKRWLCLEEATMCHRVTER